MRVSAASSRLFCLPGIWVRHVARLPDRVVATVALRRLMVSPLCDDTTRSREDPRHVESPWRQLDLGIWQLQVRARLRRLCCAVHGVALGCDCFSSPSADEYCPGTERPMPRAPSRWSSCG